MGLHREGARLDLYLGTLAGPLCEEHRNPASQLLQQPGGVRVVFGTHSSGHEQKWTDSGDTSGIKVLRLNYVG